MANYRQPRSSASHRFGAAILCSLALCNVSGFFQWADFLSFCGATPSRSSPGPLIRNGMRPPLRSVEGEVVGATSSLLLPIGPFCPFRSGFSTSATLDNEMAIISERANTMQQKFAPIALDAQMGKTPDPNVVRPLAAEMRETSDMWKVVLMRMQNTEDFQGLEFYKLTEAQMARRGMTVQNVQALMTWQMEGMCAFCEGRLPPPEPEGITEEMMMDMQGQGPSALSNMLGNSGGGLRAPPFLPDSSAMQSQVVADELVRLRDDHKQLIEMGENYGVFDGAGKEMYLDQLEAVEARWEVFLARFQMMGELNPEYVREATEYLERVNLSPTDFRELIKEAHQIMRRDAQRL